jgi:cytochrome b
VAFFVAYFTEDELLPAHVWAGYVVGGIVLARVTWGLFGTPHARFTDFVYRPAIVLSYFKDLLRGKARRYLGHSPAGGAMVIVLLVALAAIVWSGLTVYAYDQHAGPLAGLADSAAAAANLEAREEFWEEAHEICVNVTLILVLLHVAGVLLASFVHKENLVSAMLTGNKRAADRDPESNV